MKNLYAFFLGQTLSSVKEDCESVLQSVSKLKHMSTFTSLKLMSHSVASLIDGDYDETMALLFEAPKVIDFPFSVSIFRYLRGFWRLILSLVMCDFNRAFSEACNLQHVDRNPYQGMALCVIFTFDSLARLTSCSPKGRNRQSTLSTVRKRLSVLQKLSNVNPKQCLGMLHLVKAKVAQIKGKHLNAITELYLSSISLLGDENLLSVQPVACEHLARYLLICNQEHAARNYFTESLKLYQKWGANYKCCLMQEEINNLFMS
jgi:hypothetical protein